MENYLETQNLSVGYGSHVIVSPIDIEVHKGEIIALIGPNGAGKSTILKTIAGQLKKNAGEVFVESEALERLKSRQLAQKLAFVSTEKIRQDRITCKELVALGRYPHTGNLGLLTAEDKHKVEQALHLVHAYDLKDSDYQKISDGQKQKIRIAMAICQESDIIILDEPTSFLDVRHKLEILEILRTMADAGKTVILSLHELELVRLVADKVLCIANGKVVCYGEGEEIYEDNFMNRLFLVEQGRFSAKLGTVFMKRMEEAPRVFVIGGNGAGIPVYRRLQKKRIPFATGILQENDLDAYFAEEMTRHVVCSPAFEAASEREFRKSLALLQVCEELIVAQNHFGTANRINEALIEEARKQGLKVNFQTIE